MTRVDERRIDEGPRRVVDQHRGRRSLGERLEPGAHRVLPTRAPGNCIAESRGEGRARCP